MNNIKVSDFLKKENLLKIITFLFCVGWLIIIHYLNEVPLDVGDGLMHFNISQASWGEPIMFLNHWGKPLFILFSSTFAQFGFDGIIFFNILVFGFTIFFAWKILNYFSIPIGLQCLFPLTLIVINDYSGTILGGLTEPLFSLFVMIATWLIISKRWIWLAITVSFMPFLRSEGQLPVVLVFILLIFLKQFKYIPFLLTGFIIYGFIGSFALNDFWWYFTQSPYNMDNDIYGSGTWNHYLLNYKFYLGNPGLFIFILAFFRLIYLFKSKKWDEIQLPWLFFTYGIFFGILVLHSYFWATGQNGSCGLLRITTQGMPSFILINLFYLGRISFLPATHFLMKILISCFIIILGLESIKTKHYPVKASPLDSQVLKAAEYLLPYKDKGNHFLFHHPLFVFKMGENPFLKNQNCIFHYSSGLKNDLGIMIKPGDFLIRDSHFGPQEMRIPLSELDSFPEMVKIKEFISNEHEINKHGEMEGVTIYRYIPSKI